MFHKRHKFLDHSVCLKTKSAPWNQLVIGMKKLWNTPVWVPRFESGTSGVTPEPGYSVSTTATTNILRSCYIIVKIYDTHRSRSENETGLHKSRKLFLTSQSDAHRFPDSSNAHNSHSLSHSLTYPIRYWQQIPHYAAEHLDRDGPNNSLTL